MMNSSGRAANLKAVLSDDVTVRTHVSKMVKTWETVSSRDSRGTRRAYLVDPAQPPTILLQDGKAEMMPDYLYHMLVTHMNNKHNTNAYSDHGPATLRHIHLSRQYTRATKVSIRGVRYCASRSIVGDSNIIFRTSSGRIEAGSVISIFEHTHDVVDLSRESPFFPKGMHNPTHTTSSIFLLVKEYSSVQTDISLPLHQACIKEGFVGGYIRQDVLEKIQIIDTSQVICHFRKLPITIGGEKFIHVYPLDRVRITTMLLFPLFSILTWQVWTDPLDAAAHEYGFHVRA